MTRRLACLLGCLAAVLVPACQKDQVVAPALSVTCEARPSSGAAPLTVAFLLSVSGAEGPLTVAISYGDGQSGSNPDASHTYATAGSYTASLSVNTATQNARCSAGVTVTSGAAPKPANQPPNAVFRTTPAASGGTIAGKAPLSVSFNMCPSTDPEGDELFFEMDLDGDGQFEFKGITGFHCRTDHVYAVGTWRPLICLYDRDQDRNPLHEDACQVYTVVAAP